MDLLVSWSRGRRRLQDKDDDVKNEIRRELSRAVRVLHAEHVTITSPVVYSGSTTNDLCYSIEAIFLHGLRGINSDKPATWCFWDLLFASLHRSVIKHLAGLSQIKPGIGACRAWIRMALNGGELLCYLEIILNDETHLKKFYEDWAFLRDVEHSTFLKTSIQGLERIHFSLSYNSSLLNTWTGTGPSLAGLEVNVIGTTYEKSDRNTSDLISSWSNVDQESTSGGDRVVADCRRDASFDDFNLESAERIEIAEMFHGCTNAAHPIILSSSSKSTMTAAVPVSVPSAGGVSVGSGEDQDEGVWSATSDVELSMSTGQYHGGGAATRESSSWMTTDSSINMIRRFHSNKSAIAVGKRFLGRQRPHSVAEEVQCECPWTDETENPEQRRVTSDISAMTVDGPVSRDEFTSADFERWLGSDEVERHGRGGADGQPHQPWRQSSVDSGRSSVESSSSLDRLPFNSVPLSRDRITGNVGPPSRSVDGHVGRDRRLFPVLHRGGEDEFLFETPYESESYLTVLNNYSSNPFRIQSQTSCRSTADMEDVLNENDTVHTSKSAPMLMTSNLTETTYGDWIVMEYNEEDYVNKPFHVDSSTAHLHQFVTTENHGSSLVKQEGRCVRCFRSIETGKHQQARACHFTGYYYCNGCYGNKKSTIPARIIHEWDFGKFAVSKESFSFLSKTNDWPMLDVKTLNPDLFDKIENLSRAHRLRLQISHIVRYMLACTADDCQKFWRWMNPRFHVFQHIHHYSVKELEGVKDGSYLGELRKIVQLGVTHIMKCVRCTSRGYICEICNSDDVIFPHDIEHTISCPDCNAVYHKHCRSSYDDIAESASCIRCSRLRRRNTNSLTAADSEAVSILVDQVVFCFPTDISS